jgi:hypothetical protein
MKKIIFWSVLTIALVSTGIVFAWYYNQNVLVEEEPPAGTIIYQSTQGEIGYFRLYELYNYDQMQITINPSSPIDAKAGDILHFKLTDTALAYVVPVEFQTHFSIGYESGSRHIYEGISSDLQVEIPSDITILSISFYSPITDKEASDLQNVAYVVDQVTIYRP